MEILVFAFFGLILTSANYAIITGEEADYAAGRAVSEGVFAAGAFAVSGILVLYAIILLLHAVERSTEDRQDASARTRGAADESDFGRVKRHLCAVTGTAVIFVLVLMVAPGIRLYADVTDRSVVEVIGWVVVAAQFLLSSVVGMAYLAHHRRGPPPPTEWSGTSRFGLLSLGFVLASTLLCQWAGQLSPCDQMPWPVVAAAVAIYGGLMAYASIVIESPWLRRGRS